MYLYIFYRPISKPVRQFHDPILHHDPLVDKHQCKVESHVTENILLVKKKR